MFNIHSKNIVCDMKTFHALIWKHKWNKFYLPYCDFLLVGYMSMHNNNDRIQDKHVYCLTLEEGQTEHK